MFQDRKEAGQKLARALGKYRNKEVLVLAIPKGGVEVAFEVAKYLNADFSMLISRKLPFPDNPEAGFGAISEDGSTFIIKEAPQWLPEKTIRQIEKEQLAEIKRRIKVLRENKHLPKISDRIIILIDDGLAMGSTMQASIMLCRKKKAKKIVVAVPVAGKVVAEEIKKLVDELVVLEQPEHFGAVAQVYENWYDVSDEEVLGIMDKLNKRKRKINF